MRHLCLSYGRNAQASASFEGPEHNYTPSNEHAAISEASRGKVEPPFPSFWKWQLGLAPSCSRHAYTMLLEISTWHMSLASRVGPLQPLQPKKRALAAMRALIGGTGCATQGDSSPDPAGPSRSGLCHAPCGRLRRRSHSESPSLACLGFGDPTTLACRTGGLEDAKVQVHELARIHRRQATRDHERPFQLSALCKTDVVCGCAHDANGLHA